ncbi:hypothetical protein LTR36_000019 [Oleoguttula mirabilis]|uniref:Uncharacterized protein n=1 Tax=Oleoguttula mirabilis TaxID=1507867 RepID=A0AAV9JXE4_9PEZI|nr:hypothetical protein LTR36_000019 [Oleoguttula mirabilis]
MTVCATAFRRSHSFVDNSPVQPSRASRYTLDRRSSLGVGERSDSSSDDFAFPQASQSQQQAHPAPEESPSAPQASQPNTTGHRRTSSLDKFLKKVQGMLKHKSSTASFASVLVKTTTSNTSALPPTLRHKKDLLNLRFEFEQSESASARDWNSVAQTEVQDHESEQNEVEDNESAWVTDDESETCGVGSSR